MFKRPENMKYSFYHQFLSMTGPPVSSVFTGSLLHYRICNEVLDETWSGSGSHPKGGSLWENLTFSWRSSGYT